ncbi:hypothetical protein C7271_04720 [filamentous cyanobacterium CCP5]|nr:hypothetical protein C7271_04720 [filamentous cyanobacterium CCP5]
MPSLLDFQPMGAMTQETEGVVSAQADESYCIDTVKAIPDLSIEVVFTSGSFGKLERYKALGEQKLSSGKMARSSSIICKMTAINGSKPASYRDWENGMSIRSGAVS